MTVLEVSDDGGGEEFDDTTMSSIDLKTKQQRKEEGRRRALEIAMANQKISNNVNESTYTNTGKRRNRKSARHGARNQHRHKHFARWILERFPHVLEECVDAGIDEQSSRKTDASTTPMHILDVAGGKGELSARLSLCHSLHVVMVDPRPADIESVYMNSVVPKLPEKWQKSINVRLQQSSTFVQDELAERFAQLVMPFTAPSHNITTPAGEDDIENQFQDATLHAAVSNASLIIGLHADGATEAIVDAALHYHKPFVVVPCCVFPNLFRDRYITVPISDTPDESGQSTNEGRKQVPVRTHDQFCTYLLDKDPRFVREVLPFEGRNDAIWWDGK